MLVLQKGKSTEGKHCKRETDSSDYPFNKEEGEKKLPAISVVCKTLSHPSWLVNAAKVNILLMWL